LNIPVAGIVRQRNEIDLGALAIQGTFRRQLRDAKGMLPKALSILNNNGLFVVPRPLSTKDRFGSDSEVE
jgi:hypothetical protein